MKKLIASLFAATLLAAGLVTASGGTSATAATSYPHSVKTKTTVKARAHVKKNKKVKIGADVLAPAHATGVVVIKIKRAGKVVKTLRVQAGKKVSYRYTKRGKYTVVASFRPGKNSVFSPSSAIKTVRVK